MFENSSAVDWAEQEEALTRRVNVIGIVSWALIGVGILVVLIVLFLVTRGPPGGGMGRKRYREQKESRTRRMMDDNHYRKY